MTRPAWLTAKLIAYVVGGLILLGLVLFTLHQCQQRRSQAAQSRVERSQAQAASNSAADAINAVTGVGSNQAASEELGRANEKDIRNAEGANERVNAGVNSAGLRALCKRQAYRNTPRCAAFKEGR